MLAGRGWGNTELFCLLEQERSWMGGIEKTHRQTQGAETRLGWEHIND